MEQLRITREHLLAVRRAGACDAALKYSPGQELGEVAQTDLLWVEERLPDLARSLEARIGVPFWAAGHSGAGDGSGYGDGDGSGCGYGDVYDDGSGCGYGDNYGNHFDDGNGNGFGFGYGYGYNFDDGSGCGYGDNYGNHFDDGNGFGFGYGYGYNFDDGSGCGNDCGNGQRGEVSP